MVSYFGNRRTTADTSYRVASPTSDNQRACIFGPFPENGWATKMAVWGGKETTSPKVMLCCWNVQDKVTITDRRGYTNSFQPSASMLNAAGGTAVTANLNHMNTKYSPDAVLAMKVNEGDYYALGFTNIDQNFPHAVNTDDQKALHRQTVAGLPPSDPFVATNTGTSAELDVWMEYQPNRAPSIPTTLSPSGTVGTQTPTITGNFSDLDTGYGDRLKSYRIQVREVGTTGTLLLNQTFQATTAEQTAAAFSRVYAGATLSAGKNYEWRCYVTDQHDANSDWSVWTTFTVSTAVGTVTVPVGASPTGKQTTLSGYTFQAYWNHTGGLQLDYVMVEIRQRGVVTQKKEFNIPNVASSALPGTFFTVGFDTMGFEPLVAGEIYSWRMKGKDTSGVYSEWSSSMEFTTNTKPGAPSGLTPNNSQSMSNAPVLKMSSTDYDDTPVSTGGSLSAVCRIYNKPYIPNRDFTANIAGWVASNTGDVAGATTAWTWGNTDFSGDGWGLNGYMRANISASTAGAGVVYHSDLTGVWMPCVQANTYDVQAEFWTTTANLYPELYIKWYTASRVLITTSAQTAGAPRTTAVNTPRFSATAPGTAAFYQVGVRLRTTANNQTGTVYLRDIGPTESGGLRVPVRTMTWNATTERWNYQTLVGTNDVQTISKTGTVTGGNWTFTFNGATTANIAWNASATTVQSAIEALSTVGTGNVVVTGTGPWTITFSEKLAGTYQNDASVTNVSLTGTTPGIAISHTTGGTISDLGPKDKYWWDCYSNDTVYSSDVSDLERFYYVSGPVVAITSHSDGAVITTSKPTITWTAASQLKYQVIFYAAGTTTIKHDSGLITSAIQAYQPPTGTLRNNTSYDLVVYVTNTSGIVGSNAPIRLNVSMSSQPALGFQVSERLVGMDDEASAVLLGFDTSDIAPSLFVEYIIGRRETGDDIDRETIIQRLTNINQKSYIDYFPQSGVDYTYTLRQSTRASSSSDTVVESDYSEASATVTFSSVIISSTEYPSSRRAVLRFVTDRTAEHTRNQTVLPTWGNRAPVILQDQTNYQKISGTFTVVADSQGTALEYIDALRNLWNNGDTCCFRDDRGRKVFGMISRFSEKDEMFGQYVIDLEFTETSFREGAD